MLAGDLLKITTRWHEVWFIQEICSKKRRITVELSKISMPISNSGFSRTGSMIEIQRSW